MGFTEASLDAMRYELTQELTQELTEKFEKEYEKKYEDSKSELRTQVTLENERKLIVSIGQSMSEELKSGISLDDLMRKYLISEENRQFLEAELSKYA